MTSLVGTRVAGYRLDALVGSGGGGVVYRARHLRLDRTVALKVLSPRLADDKAFRRRFEREAQLAASLEHPHIIPVYDAGEAGELLYLAMRFVEGPDLSSLIRARGRLDLHRTCAILAQVAAALDAAHAAGLVHRDVKPANILVAPFPEPGRPEHAYLADFGLTHRLEGTSLSGRVVAGTFAYMAPERFQAGAPPEAAVDIYALGCVAYACLSGFPPFGGDSLAANMAAHMFEPPPNITAGTHVPRAVDAVLARAIAKQPSDRYPTCGAFVDALRAAADTEQSQPKPAPTLPVAAGDPTWLTGDGTGRGSAAQRPAGRLLAWPVRVWASRPRARCSSTTAGRSGLR